MNSAARVGLLGARHFDRISGNPTGRAFLAGAAILLLSTRRGVVLTLLAAAAAGSALVLAGANLPH